VVQKLEKRTLWGDEFAKSLRFKKIRKVKKSPESSCGDQKNRYSYRSFVLEKRITKSADQRRESGPIGPGRRSRLFDKFIGIEA
jgi:hypothetical protein